jgi:hypothetical protein
MAPVPNGSMISYLPRRLMALPNKVYNIENYRRFLRENRGREQYHIGFRGTHLPGAMFYTAYNRLPIGNRRFLESGE